MAPKEIFYLYEKLHESGKTAREIVADFKAQGISQNQILTAFHAEFSGATSADQAETIDLFRADVLQVVE